MLLNTLAGHDRKQATTQNVIRTEKTERGNRAAWLSVTIM